MIRILVVEDNQTIRAVARAVARALRLEMREAVNGREAVEYFQEGNTCDLVLMDRDMPIMDGHQATMQLRTMGIRTPIVALSADNSQADRDVFLRAGADEFLPKPLTKENLVRVLAEYGLGV